MTLHSQNRKNIQEKTYSKLGLDTFLTLTSSKEFKIENNKLTIIYHFIGGYTTWVYRFNNKGYVISQVITQSISLDVDSTYYIYSSDDYLSKEYTIRYLKKNKKSILFTSNSIYNWSNGNLTTIISSYYSPHDNPFNKHIAKLAYNELLNPLQYSYFDDTFSEPYLKYGKSTRNLVSNVTSVDLYRSNVTNYYYKMLPTENSYNVWCCTKEGAPMTFKRIQYK